MKIKVLAGKFSVGDEFRGKTIKSIGEPWKQKIAGKDHFGGQLWESCSCGQEPIYMPHDMCENCINKQYGNDVEVCYIYFE